MNNIIGQVDSDYWNRDYVVVGVDEVGRGSLAGPVLAGACVLNPPHIPCGIDDSKKLSPNRRTGLAQEIQRKALAVSYGMQSAQRIDEIGIRPATLLAMKLAVEECFSFLRENGVLRHDAPWIVLVDGLDQVSISLPGLVGQKAIVRGDSTSLSIAAASICAKVKRDGLMEELAVRYPKYGFDVHKGYGTSAHIKAIRENDPSPQHRRSFLRKVVDEELSR